MQIKSVEKKKIFFFGRKYGSGYTTVKLYNGIVELSYIDTLNNPADIITRQKFKNIAKESEWWGDPDFLVNDTKCNEKDMHPEILLKCNI